MSLVAKVFLTGLGLSLKVRFSGALLSLVKLALLIYGKISHLAAAEKAHHPFFLEGTIKTLHLFA